MATKLQLRFLACTPQKAYHSSWSHKPKLGSTHRRGQMLNGSGSLRHRLSVKYLYFPVLSARHKLQSSYKPVDKTIRNFTNTFQFPHLWERLQDVYLCDARWEYRRPMEELRAAPSRGEITRTQGSETSPQNSQNGT